MKIISEKKSHAQAVRENGKLKINNITFVLGQGGKATAFDVSDAEISLFCGVDGFSFYHDDDTHAGTSDTYRPKVTGVFTLNTAGDLEGQLSDLISSGQLTPDMIARLTGANIVGAPTNVPSGTLVDSNGFPVTSGAATTPAPAPAAPTSSGRRNKTEKPAEPKEKADVKDDPKDNDQKDAPQDAPDYTNLEFVSTLNRSELMGVAKTLEVDYQVTQSNPTIAQLIVEKAQEKAANASTPTE